MDELELELQPPETSITPLPIPISTTPPTTSPPPPPPPPLNPPPPPPTTTTTTTKRHRRPSVRLGEIGGDPPPPPSPTHRRTTATWRFHKNPLSASKSSKTRPLTNLVHLNGDVTTPRSTRPKSKRPTKRARTNWSKFDDDELEDEEVRDNNNNFYNNTSTAVGGGGDNNNNNNGDFRAFEPDGLSEPESPNNSTGLNHYWDRRGTRTRANNNNNINDDDGDDGDNENINKSVGVKEWLIGLGLGRYAPVFDIHEVDDEVLTMLTLEDLKDMGINAVGSRRKMYNAILKLRKGFS